MIIKDRDPAEKAVAQLTDLLSLDLSSAKKFLVERELKAEAHRKQCQDGLPFY